MKQLILQILNILKGLNTFQFIAIYNNQVDRLRLSLISFNCPACFIEIQRENVLTLQNGVSSYDLILRFHIVDYQLDAGNGSLDQNLSVFKYRNLLRKTFVQTFLKQCGPIQADGDEQDYKHQNIYHYIQSFRCNYIDTSANQIFDLLQGYIKWDENQLIWNQCLSTWNDAWWGAPQLEIGVNIIEPTSHTTVFGNDIVSIYKSIFNKVNTLVNDRNQPIFKNVYVFNDQIKRLIKSMNTYNYPSLFVEIKQDKETPLQNKLSRMDLVITFHILAEELDNGNAYSPIGLNLDQNTYVFYLRDLINKNMVLFFAPQCGPLQYYSEEQDYAHTNVYHYKISYKAHYIDQTAYQQFATMSATASFVFNVDEIN